MGKTYRRTKSYDDEFLGKRTGKPVQEQRRQKQANLRTLNKYVEDFDDEFDIDDEIFIEHTKHTP